MPPKTRAAFTILELLIVISIIIVLAGLILAASGYVQNKGKRSRAEAEIAALSAALENYKADNGIYPANAATNALTSAVTDTAAYRTANLFLYCTISGDVDNDRDRVTEATAYFPFKPNQLSPSLPPPAKVDYIRDPFGNPFGYSTSKNSTANPNAATSAGNNPTFDLWSTATSSDPQQWIKNW